MRILCPADKGQKHCNFISRFLLSGSVWRTHGGDNVYIEAVRIAGNDLILTTKDATARRLAYDFKPGEYELKKTRKKRSLDANAYFFVLADKLSEVLNIPKEDIYRNYVKDIGGVSEIVCVKDAAVAKLCEGWRHNGLGWQTDTLPSKLKGCTNVILYYGSSTYDTAQMSRLIDRVVEDCKIQGIETKTPEEIANLLSLWESEP